MQSVGSCDTITYVSGHNTQVREDETPVGEWTGVTEQWVALTEGLSGVTTAEVSH